MSWNDQRPMSPHLQVYQLPLTAWLSFLHRATGIVLFIGILMTVFGLTILATQKPEHWHVLQTFLSSYSGHFVLFLMSFSLYYHLCNGIRHLFWDIGKGFTLLTIQRTNLAVLMMSSILTFITWVIA